MDRTATDVGQSVRSGALSPHALDRAEQIGIAICWSLFAGRMLLSANPYAGLVALSEFAVVAFTLVRRPATAISTTPGDWLLACTATFAPLLVIPTGEALPAFASAGLSLLVLGTAWQLAAKLVLRRSFGIGPANRGIKVSGPYRTMRHPIYAGYLCVHLGALMLLFSWANLLIYAIGWSAQLLRMRAEERLLAIDPAYRAYVQRVRWRLLPGVF